MRHTLNCATPGYSFFFFNDTATTEIYTLSLHDALPISPGGERGESRPAPPLHPVVHAVVMDERAVPAAARAVALRERSEEHTSELQSQSNLVCRLLLEKKNRHTETAPAVPPPCPSHRPR